MNALSFLGGAGTVTGSRHLLELAGQRILIDCGLFQGYKQLRLRNWAAPPFDPRSLDAVVLTHAHIDHSGYLPALVRACFRGRIWCSKATYELCRILLPDSAHLQEEDAKFANRHGTSKHHPALPLYTQDDVEKCLRHFKSTPFGETAEIAAGVRMSLQRAGHLLGAGFAHIEAAGLALTFSGDLGRNDDPMMQPPEAPPASDYVIIESTYGDRLHPAVDGERELGEWLNEAYARRAVVVIPAFAVGRAQTLLLHIARLKAKKLLPDVPVFLDSPMAIDASELYVRFERDHRLSREECQSMFHAATLVNTPEQSKALDQRDGPMIIISASGMATGGRVVHHLKAFLGDSRNLILLAGFQAPGTRGAALANGAPTVRIHGQDFIVRAQVGQLRASSSHADADGLIGWLKQLPRAPRSVFVTHGEPAASDALRYRIEHELKWEASAPDYRDRVELKL